MQASILGKSSVFMSQSSLPKQTQHLVPLIRQTNFQSIHKCLSPHDILYQDPKSRNLLYYSCYYNKPDTLLYLINKGVPINQLDSEGRNLWHVCAYTGSLYCFGILLGHSDCLRRMIAGKNLKQSLEKYKFKKSDYKNGELVISTTEARINDFKAFKESARSIIKAYFKNKLQEFEAGLSTQDSSEARTPLHLASLNKSQRSFQIIELMLRESVPEYRDYLELSQRVSSAIENYEDPRIYNNIISDLGNAVGAAEFDQIQLEQKNSFGKFLKTIINLKDKGGFTALHLASYGGSSAISAILKRAGALISDPQSSEGQNVVEIAKNNSVRNTIINLCEASEMGDNSTISLLINCGQDINVKKTIFGITPLYNSIVYCQKTNKADPAKILLENGADINSQDVNGWTSLHKACEIGNLQMVELLLSNKANTKRASNKGWIPLHIAAANNHYEIISLLHSQDKEINLNAKDHEGATPLILAAKRGSNKAICKLLELGANLYACDNKKMTSLHYATFKQHLDTIKTLLYYDADFDKLRPMKNCHGKPAKQLSNDSVTRSQFDNVWSASREGKLDVLRRLILEGANKDEQTYNLKRTPLMYGIMGGHVLVTKYLLESGASTYPEDSNEQTATNYASEYSKTAGKKQKEKEETGRQLRRLLEQFQS